MTNPHRSILLALFAAMSVIGVGCSKPTATTSTMAPGPAAESNVADIDVTTHVKTALLQDEVLKAFDIQVITLKGDVRLIGVLDNQAQIDSAIKVARAAEGAHSIHDELSIRK